MVRVEPSRTRTLRRSPMAGLETRSRTPNRGSSRQRIDLMISNYAGFGARLHSRRFEVQSSSFEMALPLEGDRPTGEREHVRGLGLEVSAPSLANSLTRRQEGLPEKSATSTFELRRSNFELAPQVGLEPTTLGTRGGSFGVGPRFVAEIQQLTRVSGPQKGP